MALSSSSDLQRVAAAAASPGWNVEVIDNQILATRESGIENMPYSVVVRRGGRGYKVAKYQPGDDISVEGDDVGELTGTPRDMGRQLRGILEEA